MTSVKIQKLTGDGEVERIIREEISFELCPNFILVGEEATLMPDYYAEYVDPVKNFAVRNSDIIVASYPKTGTTWTQEMVWLIANDCNFEAADKPLSIRFPFFESCSLMDNEKFAKLTGEENPEQYENSIEFSGQQPDPRFIKTHLPFSLLPDEIKNSSKSPKIIYVMRNPKDACVSYVHHGNLVQGWKTSIENFAKVFLDDKAIYGSFWKHIFGYWEHRNAPNVLIIKYEDMKADLPSVIRKVANFLQKVITSEQIAKLCNHLSFNSMKQNKNLNGEGHVEIMKKLKMVFEEEGAFIRSGTVGKYKEEMPPETISKFDAWIKKNIAGTSLEQEFCNL